MGCMRILLSQHSRPRGAAGARYGTKAGRATGLLWNYGTRTGVFRLLGGWSDGDQDIRYHGDRRGVFIERLGGAPICMPRLRGDALVQKVKERGGARIEGSRRCAARERL